MKGGRKEVFEMKKPLTGTGVCPIILQLNVCRYEQIRGFVKVNFPKEY